MDFKFTIFFEVYYLRTLTGNHNHSISHDELTPIIYAVICYYANQKNRKLFAWGVGLAVMLVLGLGLGLKDKICGLGLVIVWPWPWPWWLSLALALDSRTTFVALAL